MNCESGSIGKVHRSLDKFHFRSFSRKKCGSDKLFDADKGTCVSPLNLPTEDDPLSFPHFQAPGAFYKYLTHFIAFDGNRGKILLFSNEKLFDHAINRLRRVRTFYIIISLVFTLKYF